MVKGAYGVNKLTQKRINSLRSQLCESPALVCSGCKIHIHEAITGKYETKQGTLCKRCFSERIGNEIEVHPLRSMPPEKTA